MEIREETRNKIFQLRDTANDVRQDFLSFTEMVDNKVITYNMTKNVGHWSIVVEAGKNRHIYKMNDMIYELEYLKTE